MNADLVILSGFWRAIEDVSSGRINFIHKFLASDTTVTHLVKALVDAFQTSGHKSVFHRLHFAISKKAREVFQVGGGGLVVIGHGWVIFEEEPEGLDWC